MTTNPKKTTDFTGFFTPEQGRTFRRKTQSLWEAWTMSSPTGEAHRVTHIDGIYMCNEAVVLITKSQGRHVIA